MIDIVGKRGLWFAISAILTVPALAFMVWSFVTAGTLLPLSIDYTGGTLWELRFQQAVHPMDVRQVFVDADHSDSTVFNVEDDQTVQVKFATVTTEAKQSLAGKLQERFGPFEERFYRSIGPAIGSEVSRAAIGAVAVASALILVYIGVAFKSVSHPIRYGACAVLALLHDVFVTLSFICIMSLIAGWQLDALSLTAILTVIGYSVNDSVVVFDRIRENLRRYRGVPFAEVANRSIVETAQRSIGTQVVTLLVLVSILVLGGATLRQFTATLIVGIISGAYSSVFNATTLLVAWDERSLLGKKGSSAPGVTGGTAAVA